MIRPRHFFDEAFPGEANALVSLRVGYGARGWVEIEEVILDLMAAAPRVYGGRFPVLCHHASMTSAVDDLLRLAGHEPSAKDIPYAGQTSYEEILRSVPARKWRIINSHIPEAGFVPDTAYVVPPPLQRMLNDKSRLADFVPGDHVLPRSVIDVRTLSTCRFDRPVVLKPVTDLPTGGGFGIMACRDAGALSAALAFFSAREAVLKGVVVETLADFTATWCVQTLICPSGVRFVGAARQNVAEDCRWLGNHHGAGCAAPAAARDLAITISEQARALGYSGFAGFDMGLTAAGRLFVFDLNFRVNGSLPQLLFDPAIRSDGGVSKNFRVRCKGAFHELAEVLRPYLERAVLFPLAGIDGAAHPGGESLVSGYLCAPTQAEVERLEQAILSQPKFARNRLS